MFDIHDPIKTQQLRHYYGKSHLRGGGGGGKARLNVATPTYATVTCTAYVLPHNL